MPWFKVDDGFHSHAKAMTAGTPALGLWVRCGSWSAYHLTDGFVPANVAREYGAPGQIKALITAGLWLSVDGGYQFNDFTDYNPTSEQVKADRDAAKERQRRAREAAKQKRDAERSSKEVTDASRRDRSVTHGVTTGEVTDLSQSPRPDPTRPEGSNEPSRGRRKRATPPPDHMLISDEMRSWAAENAPDVKLVVETAKMLDWARGKGEKKADWQATWRNWMRRCQTDVGKDRDKNPSRFNAAGAYTAWDA
jgi:hypothetical protein